MKNPASRCLLAIASALLVAGCTHAADLSGWTGSEADLAEHGDLGAADALAGADLASAVDLAGAPTLALLAGSLGGPGNHDGAGEAARFSTPSGLDADDAGNLFIADDGNHTLRKLVLATGVVSTFAGLTRTPGAVDGAAANARFFGPGAIAHAGGALYVADLLNFTIRRVDLSTGAVTTIAGVAGVDGTTDGVATGRLSFGSDMVYGGGLLYVTEFGQNTVRAVDPATGEITTLAGTPGVFGSTDGVGAAGLMRLPAGIAYSNGLLYIAEEGNCAVRVLDPKTRSLSTLAGKLGSCDHLDGVGPAARFAAPYGIAADGAGNLYVSDVLNGAVGQTIRKIEIATGSVSTLAGTSGMSGSVDGIGAAARFYYPQHMRIGSDGRLYVASYDETVRAIDLSTRQVTTVAGHAGALRANVDGVGEAARFISPRGMCSDGLGNVYVADMLSFTIRKVVVATGETTTLAGAGRMMGSTDGVGEAARFYSPRAVACEGAIAVYVADIYNNSVRRIDLATRAVTTLVGTAGTYGADDGFGAAARFNLPTALALDGAGALYIADRNNHVVRRVALATGQVTTVAGGAGVSGASDGPLADARFYYPEGIVTDGPNTLFVTDALGGSLRRVDLASGQVTTVAGGATGKALDAIAGSAANDGKGHLYLPDERAALLRRYTIATGTLDVAVGVAGSWGIQLGALPSALGCPAGALALPGGDVLISDSCENDILIARRL